MSSTHHTGLTTAEAQQRLHQYGPNHLHLHRERSWQILLRQFKSPFIYLLVAAILISFFVGETTDGLMILLFVTVNILLGFFQEYRSRQALKALEVFTTPHAHVIRNGKEQIVAVIDLVPGDIVKLKPGDMAPTDLKLVEVANLVMNESILTGETEGSAKKLEPPTNPHPAINEQQNMVFSGTSVVSGTGLGEVVATGNQAYIGTIAKLTVETPSSNSFEKGMAKFSQFVLKLVGVTLSIVFVANVLLKGGQANIGGLLVFTIALATAVIPEALPLVITFSLSRGALKLAKHKVVVKRLSAIEDLGGIQVLCTDKTGTITENKLSVTDIFGEDKNDVLYQAHAAAGKKTIGQDPFDTAIVAAFSKQSAQEVTSTIVAELPFDPERKRNSILIKDANHQQLLVVRGAAEAIVPYLKTKPSAELEAWIHQQGVAGNRVLVVAHKSLPTVTHYDQTAEEDQLVLTGAIAFADPLKASAAAAIAKAETLGVIIKIITGDGATVAGTIGQQVGLVTAATEVITGQEFFALAEDQQLVTAQKMSIFARFSPQQKNQLIDILQQRYTVGFLGEGINDAPALKSADVALVVEGASDIARETADIILLNTSLSTIIDGIQEGREVFANTIKYVKMTLASNFGNFYAVAVASLLIPFLPMLPIQILLVNLLSDFPLIAIATDSVDEEDTIKPETFNLTEFALIATIIGSVSTVFDFLYFRFFVHQGPHVLQTNWFIGSILTELVLMYSLRTRHFFLRTKPASWPIIVLTLAAAAGTLIIPFTQFGHRVFQFMSPTANQLTISLTLVGLYLIATEIVKLLYYNRASHNKGTANN